MLSADRLPAEDSNLDRKAPKACVLPLHQPGSSDPASVSVRRRPGPPRDAGTTDPGFGKGYLAVLTSTGGADAGPVPASLAAVTVTEKVGPPFTPVS